MPVHTRAENTNRNIISLICSPLSAIIGITGLCGWLFDSYFLRSLLSDGATMKVNTAVLLISGGIGLSLLNQGYTALSRLLFGLVILLSFGIMCEHILNMNLGIDELLMKDHFTNVNLEPPGRTSLLTAINALLLGVSMFLLSVKHYRSAQLLASCAFIVIYISLMGHLFHISGFYHLGKYSGVAFHTALGLTLLAIGILTFEPRQGWVVFIYQRLAKKNMLIYFLSYFLGAAPLFAAVYLFIIQHGSLSPSSDIIILITLTAILSTPIAYFLLRMVNRMGADLARAGQRLEIALDAGKLGSYDLNIKTGNMVCSEQCKQNYGLTGNDAFNFPDLLATIVPEHLAMMQEKVKDAIDGKHFYNAEYQVRWPDNSLHWIIASGKPQYDEDGIAVSIIGVTQEVTATVNATIDRERTLEQARLSKEAAQLGTFDMDLLIGTMEWDDRCRLLFGISHNKTVTYNDDFLPGLHEEDRNRIGRIINDAFIKKISNGDYDVEYRTVGVEDGKLRWVRAKGKVFFDENDKPVRFIGSVLDITDQKQDELRKNDFIGMVSHELKTPLTSLKGFTQILQAKAEKQGDNFAVSALSKMDKQVNKMNTMIMGFLNISRLESSKIRLEKQKFNMDDLIQEIIDENILTNSNRPITLIPGDPFSICADRDKIGYVINNLISNAVKYSSLGDPIELRCELNDGQAQISVKDEGIGIKQPDIDRLFERYYRIENQQTQHISGFGIGLYLCSEIIHQHNGDIGVKSKLGKGSTFYFTLPVQE